MSDDIPAVKRGRPRKPAASRVTEPVTIQFTLEDFDGLCHMARLKREEHLRKMLRTWVLERLNAERRLSQHFHTQKNTDPQRVM